MIATTSKKIKRDIYILLTMRWLAFIIAIILLTGCVTHTHTGNRSGEKKILIVVAPTDFNYSEYSDIKNYLTESGFKVVIASKADTAVSENGKKVTVDVNLAFPAASVAREKLNLTEYTAFILIGGKGVTTFFDRYMDAGDSIVADIVKVGWTGKIIGAIGTAPLIIANILPQSLLKGKNMTCDPLYKENLTSKGIRYAGEGVFVDGNIITATNDSYAKEFVEKIKSVINKP